MVSEGVRGMKQYFRSLVLGSFGAVFIILLMPIFAIFIFIAGILGIVNVNKEQEE